MGNEIFFIRNPGDFGLKVAFEQQQERLVKISMQLGARDNKRASPYCASIHINPHQLVRDADIALLGVRFP
ncbi:hypothetical protein D3C84_1225550 [compost metagenome]